LIFLVFGLIIVNPRAPCGVFLCCLNSNIKGKVIVITGASSGLGEAAARGLSAEGAIVVLGARRVDRIKALANELNAGGGKAVGLATHQPAGGCGYQ